MATCPGCWETVEPDARSCPHCRLSFQGPKDPRPLRTKDERQPLSSASKLQRAALVVALLPVPLGILGAALVRLLSCSSNQDRVHSCELLPAAEPVLTFLTIYCGWGIVFWIPPGLLVVALLKFWDRN